jgi:hypothetical protein
VSVLLVAPPQAIGEALVERLIGAGDQVRVIELEREREARWRELGAFVAPTTSIDGDLVERAGHGARTIVVFDPDLLEAVVDGAQAAGVGRIVVCSRRVRDKSLRAVDSSGLGYVAITTGRLGPGPDVVAEAIDAADDLPGEPRLEVDLRQASSRAELRLET